LLFYTARPEFHAQWPLRAHHTQINLNRLNARNVRTMVEQVAARKALADETVAAGRIFDVSGSYAMAFGVFTAMWLGAALAIYACVPLEEEIARLNPRTRERAFSEGEMGAVGRPS